MYKNRIIQTFILAIIFCISDSLIGQLKITDSLQINNIIDNLIEKQSKNFNIPGTILSVVIDGKVISSKGIGYENIENNIPVSTEGSQFRVASITKTFTTLGILQLVDQGLLDLHENIRTYLPEEDYPIVLDYPITIHHLLTHTAGFEFSNVRISKEAMESGTLESFVSTSMNKQIFRPGDVFYYSNKGYGILGHLIEKYSGMRYEDYIYEKILKPLGMLHSTAYQHTENHLLPNPTTPYRWTSEGKFAPQKRQFLRNPAASTLNTTGSDMSKFMSALMDKSKNGILSIISSESFDLMSTIQFQPPIHAEAMGYGMMIDNYKGNKTLNHGGGINGFASYYTVLPELNLGIFMSESAGEDNAQFIFNIIYSLLDTLVQSKNISYPTIPITTEVMNNAEEVSGLYQLTTVTKTSFERGEKLFGINEKRVNSIGNGEIEMDGRTFKPISDNQFSHLDERGMRELGFSYATDEHPTYMYQRMFWAFEKIAWYQSALCLQITTGLGLLILFWFSAIKPLIRKIKKTKNPINANLTKRLINGASQGLLLGFTIIIVTYVIEVDIFSGTHWLFKLGLGIITLSALILVLSLPVHLFQTFFTDRHISRMPISTCIYSIGLILTLISFWSMNLIGFNYY